MSTAGRYTIWELHQELAKWESRDIALVLIYSAKSEYPIFDSIDPSLMSPEEAHGMVEFDRGENVWFEEWGCMNSDERAQFDEKYSSNVHFAFLVDQYLDNPCYYDRFNPQRRCSAGVLPLGGEDTPRPDELYAG